MRNLKKFLALVLAMMMTLSLMVTANAATSSADLNLTDSESVSGVFLEDIQVLTGMEVIKGYPDGSFKPQVEINRHQMATFIYRMTTGDTKDLKDVYLSEIAAEKFPDVKAEDSYAGYIGYCWVNGYIAGFPDGTFKPMNKVTGYQALVMILRAMGYNNPNDNFTGKDWQSLALSRARMNNLLVNIDKSVYSGTFSRPAPRELVAEMVFQGLIQPQVTYTTAMGYQKYGMEGGVLSSVLNPTLGYENFGLTNHKGIVVGNQYTGETTTKIGFSMDVSLNKGIDIGDVVGSGANDWTVVGDLASATINDDIEKAAYYYASGLPYDTEEYGITLDFVWNSDLSLFNHAVEVWYDYRGTANETVTIASTAHPTDVSGSVTYKTNLTTYAVFDRVEKAQVVVAPGAGELDPTNLNNDPDHIENLAEAVLNAGFTRRAGNTAFFNYAFARNEYQNWSNTASINAYSGPSPILGNVIPTGTAGAGEVDENGEGIAANKTAWPLYLVISNTQGNVVDVVIPLDLTLSKVTQDNNTQSPLSTGIITENSNGAARPYFDTWDQIDPTTGADYSNIANANRVDGFDAKLGDYVAAVAITGTTGPNDAPAVKTGIVGGGVVAGANEGYAKQYDVEGAAKGGETTEDDDSSYYYQMAELSDKRVKSMQKFDRDTQEVFFTDGTSAKRSVFALAVDQSFQGHDHVMAPREAGEYTFYFDAEGNWLFWETAAPTSTFVYGTYIDYQSAVASSTFRYPLVYTNANGDERLEQDVTSIDGTSLHNDYYNNNIALPKRTNTGGNSAGFVPGQYIGYSLSNGALRTVTSTNDRNTGFVQATNDALGDTVGGATINYNNFGATPTTIDATSLAIGAHPVGNGGNLFLTERTKFIVVDGAGNVNQTVKVYEGMSELLNTHKSVTIDATTDLDTRNVGSFLMRDTASKSGTIYTAIDSPWLMVYYKLEQAPYDQDYDMSDKYIDTVFIPAEYITTTDDVSGNLFFVGDSTYGLIDANNFATQYDFYQNGEKSTRWITGLPTADNRQADGITPDTGNPSDAAVITNLSDNVFYQLHDTGRKAVDGGAIYELIPFGNVFADPANPTVSEARAAQAAANKAIIGKYYGPSTDDYKATGNAGTNNSTYAYKKAAGAGQTFVFASPKSQGYLATTRNSQVAYIGTGLDSTAWTADDLFNVASASVLNLDKNFTINSMGDLNGQSSLTSNQGVEVSCILGTGTQNIGFIYVNYAPAS